MTTDRDFEGIAQAWLAGGPEELSDRVLAAVVDDIHQTRQRHARRLPWRFPTMSFSARASALLLIGVLAAAAGLAILGGVGGKSLTAPTPAPSASVAAAIKPSVIPALDTTYTSTMGGYSIGYPADWTVTPARKPWTGGYATMAYSDRIGPLSEIANAATKDSLSIYGTSIRLPVGTTFDTWFVGFEADRTDTNCGATTRNEDITIDGVVGHLDVQCPGQYLEAIIPKGGRVYAFLANWPFDRQLFESFLRTVRLTPETATP